MTTDEIRSLDGPALDAAVDVALFGYEPPDFISYSDRSIHEPFSTSIVSAWKIVEAMAAKGWTVHMRRSDGTPEPARAAFYRAAPCYRDGYRQVEEDAATVPLAICRAALLAVMEGDDGN